MCLAVAMFCHVYGAEAFKMGQCDWTFFWMLISKIPNIDARYRYNTAEAVLKGAAQLVGKNDAAAQSIEADRKFASGV